MFARSSPARNPIRHFIHPSERETRLVEDHSREMDELRATAEEMQEARDKQVCKGNGGHFSPPSSRSSSPWQHGLA